MHWPCNTRNSGTVNVTPASGEDQVVGIFTAADGTRGARVTASLDNGEVERAVAKLNWAVGFKLPAACMEDIVYLSDRKLSRDRVTRYASCKRAEDNEALVIIS